MCYKQSKQYTFNGSKSSLEGIL